MGPEEVGGAEEGWRGQDTAEAAERRQCSQEAMSKGNPETRSPE